MTDHKSTRQHQIALDYQCGTDTSRGKRDGVVVTPVEVVDFIIRGTIDQIRDRHGVGPEDPRVKILDPFGGTGIFLARLMQTVDLTAQQKIDLAKRCRMVEIDPEACAIARANLTAVMAEETGQAEIVPKVINADTFTLGDEVWDL